MSQEMLKLNSEPFKLKDVSLSREQLGDSHGNMTLQLNRNEFLLHKDA